MFEVDPRLVELWRVQSLELQPLFHQFIRANPTLPVDVAGEEWPDEKQAEYDALVQAVEDRHATEREDLITIIESEL